MNETFLFAEELLNEMAISNDRFSNNDLASAYAKAYPDRLRGGTSQNLYGLSRDAIIDAIKDAAKDFEPYKIASARHADEDELLSLAIRAINDPKFVPIKGEADPADSQQDQGGKGEEEVANDIPKNKWPSYKAFRIKWYRETVQLGWPADILPPIKKPVKIGNIITFWKEDDHTAYAFSRNGIGRASPFTNYTKKIKDALYGEFEHDVRGLKLLYEQVNSIVELEKQYFHGRLLPNIAGFLVKQAFKGMGASEVADNAFVNFLLSKIKGMTVFEYQQMILREMVTKMDLNDTTLRDLKGILSPLRNLCIRKLPLYNSTKISAEFRPGKPGERPDGYVCSFRVVQRKKDTHVFPGDAMYDTHREIIGPMSEGKLSDEDFEIFPPIEDVKKNMARLEKLKADKNHTEREILNALKPMKFGTKKIVGNDEKGMYYITFNFITHSCKIDVIYEPKVTPR
jgi:hypothetical protein